MNQKSLFCTNFCIAVFPECLLHFFFSFFLFFFFFLFSAYTQHIVVYGIHSILKLNKSYKAWALGFHQNIASSVGTKIFVFFLYCGTPSIQNHAWHILNTNSRTFRPSAIRKLDYVLKMCSKRNGKQFLNSDKGQKMRMKNL